MSEPKILKFRWLRKNSMSEAVFHPSLRRLGMPEAKLDF